MANIPVTIQIGGASASKYNRYSVMLTGRNYSSDITMYIYPWVPVSATRDHVSLLTVLGDSYETSLGLLTVSAGSYEHSLGLLTVSANLVTEELNTLNNAYYTKSTVGCIPVMGDNSQSGYVLTGNGQTSDYFHAFDNQPGTRWTSNRGFPRVLQIELPEPKALWKITASPTENNGTRYTAFEWHASHDTVTWITIFTTNDVMSSYPEPTTYEYPTPHLHTPYKYYRFHGTSGGDTTDLTQLQLYAWLPTAPVVIFGACRFGGQSNLVVQYAAGLFYEEGITLLSGSQYNLSFTQVLPDTRYCVQVTATSRIVNDISCSTQAIVITLSDKSSCINVTIH